MARPNQPLYNEGKCLYLFISTLSQGTPYIMKVAESEDQINFLTQENVTLSDREADGKLEKEEALKTNNQEWSQLNKRLESRKATTELLSRKLQHELIQMTLNMKAQINRQPASSSAQEHAPHPVEKRDEDAQSEPDTYLKSSQEYLSELANVGSALGRPSIVEEEEDAPPSLNVFADDVGDA